MCFIARFTRVALLCMSSVMLVANICAAASASAPSPARAATMVQISPVEYIKTYAGDCVTPQTIFYLGDTVCAEAGDINPDALASDARRFNWSAPHGLVADRGNIKSDPDYNRFQIPTSGDFARVGTWHVSTVNPDANREVRAKFIVRDIRNRFADLILDKWGPLFVDPGIRVPYRVILTNPGPDFAEQIEIYDEVPNDMVFYTVKQAAGPEVTCKTPEQGKPGKSVCFAKGLEVGEKLELVFYYVVSREVREGMSFTSSVEAYSLTEELDKRNNFSSYASVFPFPDSEETGVVEEER
ncbi:MAG TPA: hypothetical protein VFS10_20990 [Pyrinomonadaceae bacterium]|nr:hypothetical protein [Pyrinomonadaceae bacterium]